MMNVCYEFPLKEMGKDISPELTFNSQNTEI